MGICFISQDIIQYSSFTSMYLCIYRCIDAYLYLAEIVLVLAIGNSLRLAAASFRQALVLSSALTSCYHKALGLPCVFLAPALKVATSPRSLGSF